MNAVLTLAGLPAFLVPTSNPSVPNHSTTPVPPFGFVHRSLCSGPPASPPGCPEAPKEISPRSVLAGASLSTRSLAAWCSRIGFTLCHVFMSRCYGRVVHFRLLPTPCCHGAVAFRFRRVNVSPDRDFHPAVCTPSQARARGPPARLHRASGTPWPDGRRRPERRSRGVSGRDARGRAPESALGQQGESP
jgi:hypothetical protein